ncbi:hypothetical protein QVD17_23655 [Tagetes erecta]|uniref:Uncharacterized protein n=1 Tax=Tagetes erecta TaxID=13708 RepID=A0AAD8KED2_TARER|nr:hypothetical protein QVD17_23655 [Tagetes erecta]
MIEHLILFILFFSLLNTTYIFSKKKPERSIITPPCLMPNQSINQILFPIPIYHFISSLIHDDSNLMNLSSPFQSKKPYNSSIFQPISPNSIIHTFKFGDFVHSKA